MKRALSPSELRTEALRVLVRELGYADAIRFMLQYEQGRGDYTRERGRMLPKLSVEELVRLGDQQAKAARTRGKRSGATTRRKRSA